MHLVEIGQVDWYIIYVIELINTVLVFLNVIYLHIDQVPGNMIIPIFDNKLPIIC